MKFALLYELQKTGMMDPETGRVDIPLMKQMFDESLEQIELADSLGYDYIFEVEHHFLGDYSFSSAPELFLAAVAQRTKNIRIGHGVKLLPWGYNHPVRVAEQAATLDILSNGRLEFGTGRSASTVEMDGFGVDPSRNRAEWDESLHMIMKAWTEPMFSWESEGWSIPARPVLPKPLQQPHPPLWLAGTQPESLDIAADRGLGILHFTYSQPEHLEEKIETYKARMEKSTAAVGKKNPNFGAFTMMHCGSDDADALAVGGPGMQYYVQSTNNLYLGLSQIAEGGADSYRWYSEAAQRGDFLGIRQARGQEETDVARMADEAILCIGGPEKCVQIIMEFEKRGVDTMIMLAQVGAIPHEEIMGSLQRFGEQVIPQFRKEPVGGQAR